MESALTLWINDCRKKSPTLDTNVILTKAKKLYETFADSDHLHDSEGERNAGPGPSPSAVHAVSSSLNTSKGWFEKFQKRFGLKNVSLHGEAASADTVGAEYVNNKFKAVVEEGGYKPEQVNNMDETGLFWKRMPQKDRLTLVMCGNAAGFMIKPGLIYRSKNPRALKNKNKDALPVYWMYNSKAWMTKALHQDWFKHCFIPEAKRYLRGKGLDFKVRQCWGPR